jgi:class 3 adenylate cyclase
MPRIPIFRLGHSEQKAPPPKLAKYTPTVVLEGLAPGVDNLRHDVYLSPKFSDQVRQHIARLIARHGNLEAALSAGAPTVHSAYAGLKGKVGPAPPKPEPSDLKSLLTDLHVAALNRAKADSNICVDVLARLAVIKFLRAELLAQFAQLLERCRMILKSYEGVRQQTALEFREKVAGFQVAKKTVLRKAGQELFQNLRDIEKGTLARMRRSLFGEIAEIDYQLFLNRFMFTEDGRDDHISADHYVMLGNWDRDPDRFPNMDELARSFLQSLDLGREATNPATVDAWLNHPDNAQILVAGGTPDGQTAEGRAQEERLNLWLNLLEDAKVMDCVVASYEVVPLLSEYCPRINAQQLKNGLVSRSECTRVEKLIHEHTRMSTDSLFAAVERVANCRGAERTKVAGRFLRDFMRYHRDLRRLEALNSAIDSVNLLGNEKLRELSSVNGTLYEFLLPEEQRSTDENVIQHHVVLKADIRDSTRLTRSLMDRGLNPASYFSLNFFDPVYKLLPKYEASKVFLEGDAIILAIMEHPGGPGVAVGRACVLAREMLDIVSGYNHLLERAGLPPLELGIGICFQDSAPLYLMDGDRRIMISDALNVSDRLSSCNKQARKVVEPAKSMFNVHAFQVVGDADAGENADEFMMSYNLNGIRINEAAFRKLQKEISLQPCQLDIPALWPTEKYALYTGLVPLGNGIFKKIVIRESHIPQIDPKTSAFRRWTDRAYYEVCSNSEIYSMLEEEASAGK